MNLGGLQDCYCKLTHSLVGRPQRSLSAVSLRSSHSDMSKCILSMSYGSFSDPAVNKSVLKWVKLNPSSINPVKTFTFSHRPVPFSRIRAFHADWLKRFFCVRESRQKKKKKIKSVQLEAIPASILPAGCAELLKDCRRVTENYSSLVAGVIAAAICFPEV